jgi:hypothetical protein
MKNNAHLEYLAYSILITLSVMLSLILTGQVIFERAAELLFLVVLLLTMVFLLLSVRTLQPEYARQPVAYAYVPFIILPFYAYFIDTQILSDITFLAIQSTCLIVFGGLAITYFNSLKNGYLLFAALIFFITAFTVFWLANAERELIYSLTHLLAGAGMITASFKFPAIVVNNQR